MRTWPLRAHRSAALSLLDLTMKQNTHAPLMRWPAPAAAGFALLQMARRGGGGVCKCVLPSLALSERGTDAHTHITPRRDPW
jgi:hypothetical protein